MRLAEFTSALTKLSDAHSFDAKQLVLVQEWDGGFWNNVAEPETVRAALVQAEQWHRERHVRTRVVRGQKREVVREFNG